MENWRAELRRGKKLLARHRPARALKSFRYAHAGCPLSRPYDLAKILYYEGLSLQKLQMPGRAIRRWVESQRYIKRGYPRRMLNRITNGYGMPRQASAELDDREAFFSIQMVRYLKRKRSRKLETEAETDMIRELIDEYWEALRRSGTLEGRDSGEKMEIFRDVPIVFPFLDVPEVLDESTLYVDFTKRRRVGRGDRCTCGTGLSFELCCGRTPCADELANGEF